MALDRAVHVGERELVHHLAEAREMAVALDAVEAVVHRVAEPRGRRLREVQRVLLQERARELELLLRQAVVDERVELAQCGPQREHGLVVRQGADPHLEQLLAARAR